MFAFKPDYEIVRQRYLAWWDCAIVDRPLTSILLGQPTEKRVPIPEKPHASHRERWLDLEFQAQSQLAWMSNTLYYGDALPIAWPNLGPSIFAAFYGCELEFEKETSWSKAIIDSFEPSELAKIKLDLDGFYFKKMCEFTDIMCEMAKDKFIVGYTDIHPGGDAIADFRESQAMCLDMLTHGEEIRQLVDRVTDDFLKVYDLFHAKLSAAGMPSTSWLPTICEGKYHIPSNDFSCMISDAMFETIFLPGIARECAHMDRSIYHLDGPGALRFLDSLMDVPKMDAIQWVPGAGHDHWRQWTPVYQRIQARGKAFVVSVSAAELEEFMGIFRPEGAWLTVCGVRDTAAADAVLARVAKWR